MRTSTLLAIGAAAGLLGSAYAGDVQAPKKTRKKMQPVSIQPLQVAKVLGRDANGKFIIGQWQPYQGGNATTGLVPPIIFDAYEGAVEVCGPVGEYFPANGPLSGGQAPACAFGQGLTGACGNGDTTRWFFGTTAFYGGTLQQMTALAGGASSGSAEWINTAWYMAVGGGDFNPCDIADFNDECVLLVNSYDANVGDLLTSGGPVGLTDLENGFLGGVLLNFGQVPTGGYYYTNVDLSVDPELFFDLVEGGAYEIFFAEGDGSTPDDPSDLTGPYFGAQSMLWAPKNAAAQGTTSGVWGVDAGGWLADVNGVGTDSCDEPNGYNGLYDDGEIFDNNGVVDCPASLISMAGFHGTVGGGGCVTTLTDADITFGNNQGDVDHLKLVLDDDDRVIGNSKVFLSANEPNLVVLAVSADTTACLGAPVAATLDTQDQASQPNVLCRVRMVNSSGSGSQQVGQYNVTFNTDTDHSIAIADLGLFIQGSGAVVTELRYSTIALLSPLGFSSRTDLVELTIN
jgi:hypothetical protein